MNAEAVVAMNQLMGRLVQGLCLGNADLILEDIFWNRDDVKLNVSDLNAHIEGFSNIKKFYEENREREGLYGAFHMLHSNSYETFGETSVAQWNTHSMWVTRDENGQVPGIRFGYFRFMGNFSCIDEVWKLDRLDVHALIIFPAWENCIDKVLTQHTLTLQGSAHPDDYIQLRNLIGRYVQEGPQTAIHKFSAQSIESFDLYGIVDKKIEDYHVLKNFFAVLDEKEKENKLYAFNMMTTSPIIAVDDDGVHGKATFMAQMIYFEPIEDTKNYVQLGIGWVNANFIKEYGEWKIAMLAVEPYVLMKKMNMEIQPERPMAMREEENWKTAPKNKHCSKGFAADLFAAESLLPHWTERLKRGDTADFVTKYMDNSIEEISMGMSGPRRFGHDAVYASADNSTGIFAGSMYKRFPQFHTGGSPVAEMDEDGIHAEISWMEYGWGYVGYGVFYDEEEKHRMYRPMIGQYYHKFIKENGVWKMYYFGWKPMIQSIPCWEYNTDDVKGWASKPFKHPWPLPLEEYIDER